MLRIARLLALIVLVLAPAAGATAQDSDYHALFEDRCGRCHGHAGNFARANLAVVDGTLVGRGTGKDVAAFMGRHYGGLSPSQIADLTEIFTKQVAEGGRFRQDCGVCHGSARGVARRYLTVVDDRLMGRYSGRDMREFLASHGRQDTDGAAFFHNLLLNVARGGR